MEQSSCIPMAGVQVAVPRIGRAVSVARDLLKLSKYRLSGLVALTATSGYVMRAERTPDGAPANGRDVFLRETFVVTAGTFAAAAAANTLNQIYEIRSDALMARTRLRPLPAGRLSVVQAGAFAAAAALSGVGLLSYETNGTAAGLAAANIFLYAGLYTPLKAMSTVNTWVGAVVGALPPMLGWAAASGGDLTSPRERGAWVYGATLFLWQIPHFHALAVFSRADYAAGGLKMLAVSNPVANAMWARYTAAAMVPLGAAMASTDMTSDIFAVESAMLGAWMYRGATRMAASPTCSVAARSLFKTSILHLPITMGLMLAHRTSPVERHTAHAAYVARQQAVLDREEKRIRESGLVFYHPWETLAPFPFLPLPLLVPAAVVGGTVEEQKAL